MPWPKRHGEATRIGVRTRWPHDQKNRHSRKRIMCQPSPEPILFGFRLAELASFVPQSAMNKNRNLGVREHFDGFATEDNC